MTISHKNTYREITLCFEHNFQIVFLIIDMLDISTSKFLSNKSIR